MGGGEIDHAGSIVERLLDRLTLGIERLLALALLGAVGLNFINVIARYGFGRSLDGADEVQIFAMIFICFLGAAVVTWRNQHLRMDVLARAAPPALRRVLRACELLLLLALAGFMLVQSASYAAQMLRIERVSDTAGIPMWIPHGALAVGFGLMALFGLWRLLTGWRQ